MISTEFLITSLIVVLIPGTGVIYTLSTGLFKGAKASMFAALGCTAGIIPSLMACILGLAVIIHTSAVIFTSIKYAGVAYLLYLAWSMWNQTGVIKLRNEKLEMNGLSISIEAFLINILNPKLTLFFLAFLPQFIPANAEVPVFNMLVLGGIFMLMTLIVFILYGLLANRASRFIVHSPKITRYIQRTFAFSFAMFGLRLALSER